MVFKCNGIQMLDCDDDEGSSSLFEQSLELIEKSFLEKLASSDVSFGDGVELETNNRITDVDLQSINFSSSTTLNKLLDLTVEAICPDAGLRSLTLWSFPPEIELDVAVFKMAQKTRNLQILRVGDVHSAN